MDVSSHVYVMMSIVLASVGIIADESPSVGSVDRLTFQTRIIQFQSEASRNEATCLWLHKQQTHKFNSLSHLLTSMLPLCTKATAELPHTSSSWHQIMDSYCPPSQLLVTPASHSPLQICHLAGLCVPISGPPCS